MADLFVIGSGQVSPHVPHFVSARTRKIFMYMCYLLCTYFPYFTIFRNLIKNVITLTIFLNGAVIQIFTFFYCNVCMMYNAVFRYNLTDL